MERDATLRVAPASSKNRLRGLDRSHAIIALDPIDQPLHRKLGIAAREFLGFGVFLGPALRIAGNASLESHLLFAC